MYDNAQVASYKQNDLPVLGRKRAARSRSVGNTNIVSVTMSSCFAAGYYRNPQDDKLPKLFHSNCNHSVKVLNRQINRLDILFLSLDI